MSKKVPKTKIHPTLSTDLVKMMRMFCIKYDIPQQEFLSFAIADALGVELDENFVPNTVDMLRMESRFEKAPFLTKKI